MADPQPTVTERHSIRAIVITPQSEVLLMKIRRPDDGREFWVAPGGGREPGENFEAGLRRELREELGLESFTIGALVWRRHHTFDWCGRRLSQREDYYVVHADRFEPHMSDPVEAKVLQRFHWWPLAELTDTAETLAPKSLASIVARYLAEGSPSQLPDLEVLTD
ncbi:MAG: hypothetical protein JWM32_2747 [Verrucomicrobia bacterium]|nr:hypothetical protein [Verrucomicrobiota bacterium]